MSFGPYSSRTRGQSMTDKCLILDLDQTCVNTFDDDDYITFKNLPIYTDARYLSIRPRLYSFSIPDPEAKRGSGTMMDMAGVVRPHMRDFLLFAQSYFQVIAVWSAGIKDYVDKITNVIFMDQRRPVVVYSRNECVESNGKWVKPIEKMGEDPRLGGLMTLDNTYIVDDRPHTFNPNPGNGILIPGYEPRARYELMNAEDLAWYQLKQWLLKPEVMNSKDIRQLDKTTIFNQPLMSGIPAGFS